MEGIKFELLGNSQDIHSFLTTFGYSAGNWNYRVEREEAVDKIVSCEPRRHNVNNLLSNVEDTVPL